MTQECCIQNTLIDFSKIELDKKAIIYKDQSITYSEFIGLVLSLTEELKKKGVKPNDYVAIYMSNSIDLVLSIFAILNCNAIVVPINLELVNDQISYILNQCKPKLVVHNEYDLMDAKFEEFSRYKVDFTRLKCSNQSYSSLVRFAPEDIAYCIFTSGSTNTPKGVLLTYAGVVNSICGKISVLNLNAQKRLCLSFNIGFVASIWQILTPLMLGAQLFIYDNSMIKTPYQFMQQVEKDKINVVSLVPHSLYGYCQYISNKHNELSLDSIENIVLTGEKIDKIVIDNFYKRYQNIVLINAYGQSECSDDTFHYVIPRDLALDDVPIGKPIQNLTYRIMNDRLEEVGCGETGELFIGGKCLAHSYLNNMQLTRDKFIHILGSIFFRTGDIVKEDEDKNVICLGRADNVIKIRGYRIGPEEIETQINQYDNITQSIVTTLQTNDLNEILVAYYTSPCDINIKDITDYLATKLPKYMIPSFFIRVEDFVYNNNGKVDRKRILDCKSIETDKGENNNQLTDLQKRVIHIIKQNISPKIEYSASLSTDLNSIGLDSITFIKTIIGIETEFNFEFDEEMILNTKFSNVYDLTQYVESKVSQIK